MSLLVQLRQLAKSKTFQGLGEWHANQMGYRKMGLRFDDLIPEETDIVKEAIRRLPQREMQDRIFRFRRALNLSNNHNALEKSEWTKPEEDIPYLRPIIDQIEQELSTAQYFDNMSTIPENLRARNRSS